MYVVSRSTHTHTNSPHTLKHSVLGMSTAQATVDLGFDQLLGKLPNRLAGDELREACGAVAGLSSAGMGESCMLGKSSLACALQALAIGFYKYFIMRFSVPCKLFNCGCMGMWTPVQVLLSLCRLAIDLHCFDVQLHPRVHHVAQLQFNSCSSPHISTD